MDHLLVSIRDSIQGPRALDRDFSPVVVSGMGEGRSLYSLSRSKSGLLYLVELDERVEDLSQAFQIYLGTQELRKAQMLSVQVGVREHVMRFRDESEGKLFVPQFGVGAVKRAYLGERGVMQHIERLENIMHYVPRGSAMTEVDYSNLPPLHRLRALLP